jgi:hypothetical protein
MMGQFLRIGLTNIMISHIYGNMFLPRTISWTWTSCCLPKSNINVVIHAHNFKSCYFVTFFSSSFELLIRCVNGLIVPNCYYLFVASKSRTFGTWATVKDFATIKVNCSSVLRKWNWLLRFSVMKFFVLDSTLWWQWWWPLFDNKRDGNGCDGVVGVGGNNGLPFVAKWQQCHQKRGGVTLSWHSLTDSRHVNKCL